jgi:hypothetical protein
MIAAWAFTIYLVATDQVGWPLYIALAVIFIERMVVMAGILIMAFTIKKMQQHAFDQLMKQVEAAGAEVEEENGST